MFTAALGLGLPFDEVIRMPLSVVTMYLMAQQDESIKDSGPRKATQADIDAWI